MSSIRSTFAGIEIGRTGLSVSQKGLDVTGHNIANVDTAGYTRQRLVTTAYEPYGTITQWLTVEKGRVGSGANVMILDQIRSAYLDQQFRSEQTLYSYWSNRTQGLNYVEALFEGTEESSISAGINDLFKAFNNLTNEANDLEQRVVLQQAGINLCQSLNQIYDRLIEQMNAQNLSVSTTVTNVNTLTESIAMLNKSIYVYENNTNEMANDLRDKRNLLLDQLSGLIDITYETTSEGKLIVSASDGTELVNHTTTTGLQIRQGTDPVTGIPINIPCWDNTADPTDPATNTDFIPKSGQLKAHMDLRDNATSDTPGIPYFITQLNTLAQSLVQFVNAQHTQGFTHPASGDDSQKGINFFDVGTGGISAITAGNIKLNDLISGSREGAYYIAASSEPVKLTDPADPETLIAGNQENAKLIYDLINQTDLTGIGSFESFFTGILVDLSTTLSYSKRIQDNQLTMLLSVDNQRSSISGVSLDEEMTNLIKYQHAYSGASRVITAMDEALETLINKMGLVGRS